jgi:drug/metabolite transporter (DMT)-like permease
MFSFFKAFGILPLADVSSISFASIMIITILAIFILDEKVGIRRWIAIFFGFIGVLIVFRPELLYLVISHYYLYLVQ